MVSIRIRTVDGVIYLDDGDHYALAAKFAQDWQWQTVDWGYPTEWAAMQTQKVRDATRTDLG